MSPAKRGRKPPPRTGPRRGPAPHQQRRPPASARGLGGDQVEGRQAVRELLLGGRRVRELWVATDLDEAGVVDEILELAREMRVPVREVSRSKMAAEARTDAPQGVLAKAAPLNDVELDELAQARSPSGAKPFLIVADGVTDPGNLGALLRSASCAGAYRCRAATPPSGARDADGRKGRRRGHRAPADGARRWHPQRAPRLHEMGVWVVGLDMVAERTLFELGDVATEPIALVLGSEGHGLSRLTRQRCDLVVRIPLVGPLESLNVATAGALACYEITRHRIPHV